MNSLKDDELDLFRRFITTLPKLNRFLDEGVKGELLMYSLLDKAKIAALHKVVSELVVFDSDDHWSHDKDYQPILPVSAVYDLDNVIARRNELFKIVEKLF